MADYSFMDGSAPVDPGVARANAVQRLAQGLRDSAAFTQAGNPPPIPFTPAGEVPFDPRAVPPVLAQAQKMFKQGLISDAQYKLLAARFRNPLPESGGALGTGTETR